MAQCKDWTMTFGGRLVTGALLFVLLSEWLRPLSAMQEVTGITRVEPLILTLAGLIGVDVLRLPLLWSWLCKTVLILSLPAVFHNGSSLFDFGWWQRLVRTLAGDAEVLLRLDWQQTSPELRTLLFITAWAIVAACLFSAVYFRRFMLWFAGATAVYLLTVDWWVGHDTFPALLRVAFAGMVLHVLYVPSVLQRQHGFARLTVRKPAGWTAASLSLAVLIMGGAAIAAGTFAPQLGQPLADKALSILDWRRWDRLAASLPAMASPATSGYGDDDGRLGQPLEMNHDPAFLAASSHGNRYWRGEAKLVYTGRGWVQPDSRPVTRLTLSEWNGAVSGRIPIDGQAEQGREQAGWHLVYWLNDALSRSDKWPLWTAGEPGGLLLFDEHGPVDPALASPSMLELESGTGNVHLAEVPPEATGFMVMGFAPTAQEKLAAGTDYLQLPETLPDRVRHLARSLADPYEDPHDKALAIERYLRDNYDYSLKPAVAGEGRDFADHFLFEGKSGYCDHFSTAMTVLLRAAGIPARWVKGFVPGEEMAAEQARQLLAEAGFGRSHLAAGGWGDGDAVVYSLVRNSDAHSWVEAYLPGAGWVAFEPTPGFTGNGGASRLPAEEVAGPAEGMQEIGTAKWWQLGRRAWAWLAGTPATARNILLAVSAAAVLALLAAIVRLYRRQERQQPWRRRNSRLGITLRLMLYRIGLRKVVDGPGLLEAMLEYRLAPYRSGLGDTWREVAELAVRQTGKHERNEQHEQYEQHKQHEQHEQAGHPLWQAVHTYERLCFGPPLAGRLPAGELRALWRSLGNRRTKE